jgi:hypothetical protein
MISDKDKIESKGIRISILVWDAKGETYVEEQVFVEKVNASLGDVGTVIQRQAYELLRQCAEQSQRKR